MKITKFLESLGRGVIEKISKLGQFVLFTKSLVLSVFSEPFRFSMLVKQMEFVGNKSLSIIILSAFLLGGGIGLQVGVIFKMFSAEALMGGATGKSLALEIAPLMCGFVVTGRAGAAMASEIATMRVNEQIDAMEAMGVNSISYLVFPRVVASLCMTPILSAIFFLVGILGCYLVGIIFYNVDNALFLQNLSRIVVWNDILKGLYKATIFGFLFALIACYKGFYAKGGAKGVGEATTEAVVVALLSIITSDFLLTLFQTNF